MTRFPNRLIDKLQSLNINQHHKELFTLKTNELMVDFSRHALSQRQLIQLTEWLDREAFALKRDALFTDNLLNFTEKRAVNHVFTRDIDQQFPCAQNTLIRASTQRLTAFAERFERNELFGLAGEAITDLLTIGIGGSHLGADLVTDALSDFCRADLKTHYLTGTDPYTLHDTLSQLPAATTLVFVASKSWSTIETLWNYEKVKAWFLKEVGSNTYPQVIARQFFALTAQPDKALAAGFKPEHIFPITDAIGGRFSLWSAVGLPMRLRLGEKHFHALLSGAHAMDRHFKEQPLAENIPVILALLDFYYANCQNVQQRAVIPYTQRLRLLVNHLQQLEMESNGKSINDAGERVDYQTGLAVWGGVGPNSQHSFHQWFYQGTMCVPIDFIALKSSAAEADFDQLLLSQCLAQAKALWEGQKPLDTHAYQAITGGTPSTLLLLNTLNPRSLGELIALYEHKVFVIGLLTHTNPFDQFGVELGKSQGIVMLQAIKNDFKDLDPITKNILKNLC